MVAKMMLCQCALAGAITVAASATDRHVPSDYATIQAAIDAAEPGDVVIVADGVYTGDGNRDLNYGGKSIMVRSVNGPEATVISVGARPDAPARGVQFINGEGPDAVLEGFTITGGATPPGAISDEFNGGGILVNNGSTPTIRDCTITGNHCGCWGAAICVTNAGPTIIDCRLIGNQADDNGGGLFAWGSSGTGTMVINSVIAGNDGGSTGGGVAVFSNGTTIINSTIVGNQANSGDGVHASSATIMNSIIWGNGEEIIGGPQVSYSNVQGGYEGEGNLDIDPQFVDAAAGDYHLAVTSPVVDAGSAGLLPGGVEHDADGDPRVIGAQVDMGADEMLRTGDVNFDGAVDVDDLVQVILAWGACSGCDEDITADGRVGVDDLVQVMLNWSV